MKRRRFDVKVGTGTTIPVEVDDGNTPAIVGLAGTVDITKVDDAVYSVLLNGRSHRIRVRDAGNAYIMSCEGFDLPVAVESERSRLLKRAGVSARATEHGTTIAAPMPALIVRIEVEPGQEVAAGQGLVVLEAMKMENEIRAPRAGKVNAIPVTVGKPVEKGEVLIVLE